jgi:glycosyltransferase involved in cell wall biosynthesis
MRIAYICMDQGIPIFGRKGCSIHVQEVARALLGQGIAVDVFTPRTEGNPPDGLESLWVHALPRANLKPPAARERAAIAANQDLRQALEREGPFDLVYERYSLWSYGGMDYAQAAKIPGLLEVNAPLIDEQARYRVLIDRASAEWVAHRVFGNASALIAVSHEVAAYLREFPQTESRVRVIQNGVDPDRFTADMAPTIPRAAGCVTIGFVGTLKEWHGVSTLVEAFQLLQAEEPNARLLIVGDGPERSRIEEQLSASDLRGKAQLTGGVDPSEVPGLIASMDIAVAPYPLMRQFYFSPLKVFEYMAAGRAVVTSRIGQLSDVIEHEVTGLLCEPGSAQDLASALGRLCKHYNLRQRLGHAARARVQEEHTWESVVRKSLELAGLEPAALPLATGGFR